LQKHKIQLIFASASPTRPAPANSSRVGTQQRYVVERCDVGRLPISILRLSEDFLFEATPAIRFNLFYLLHFFAAQGNK
jgi:hypothetical protein